MSFKQGVSGLDDIGVIFIYTMAVWWGHGEEGEIWLHGCDVPITVMAPLGPVTQRYRKRGYNFSSL